MSTEIIKSKGQKTSLWSAARARMGNLKKGMLNNPALVQARKAQEKIQKKFIK